MSLVFPIRDFIYLVGENGSLESLNPLVCHLDIITLRGSSLLAMSSFGLLLDDEREIFWKVGVDDVDEEASAYAASLKHIVTQIALDLWVVDSHGKEYFHSKLMVAWKLDVPDFMLFIGALGSIKDLLHECPVDVLGLIGIDLWKFCGKTFLWDTYAIAHA